MANAQKQQQHGRSSDMSAFGGKTRSTAAEKDDDTRLQDVVGDDDTNVRTDSVRIKRSAGEDDGKGGDQQQAGETEDAQPKGPPSDETRNKIFERIRGVRAKEMEGGEDEGADDGDQGEQGERGETREQDGKGEDGKGEDDEKKPEVFELEVDGKKVNKSLDEIAVLADLDPEDVKANPQRAMRFAQRELATQERLDRAKKIVRDTSSRFRENSEDGSDQRRSSAPNQGDESGSQDDPGQQRDTRKTNDDVDFAKLVEDIQIGSPEEAAGKLKDALTRVAEQTSANAVNQRERSRAVQDDMRSTAVAMKGFVEAHKDELEGKRYMAPAIAAAMIDEYREDLRSALVSDGEDPDEAERLLSQATPDQIKNAHQARRVNGDANVRRIDRDFIESAYERVSGELGTSKSDEQQRQDFQRTRQERKENLRTQPRRSSVPPAHRQTREAGPQDETALRKKAVSEMQKLRPRR